MIKPAALILAVTMGAVSAGTYYGLDLLPPGAIPEPFGRAVKAERPKAAPRPPAPAPAAAAPMPAPAAEPAVTEQDLAEDPPPPAEEPVALAAAEPVTEPAPAPTPAPQAAAPTPAPAKTAPALQDEPPPPKPARKKVEVVRADDAEVASTAPAEPTRAPLPAADAIKPWWPDASKLPATQLKLQYAGQVQGEQAIALLFSAPLKVDSLRQHAQVKTGSGDAVNGTWELGKNPRLAVFRGVGEGRYTVILSPQVADTKGFMLGQTLQGPVYIQP